MALCGHWGPWLETWPAWGMSAGGVVFALPMPALLMGGSGSSSSPALPTPKSTNNENRQNLDRYGMNLGQALGIAPLTSAPMPPQSDAGNTS